MVAFSRIGGSRGDKETVVFDGLEEALLEEETVAPRRENRYPSKRKPLLLEEETIIPRRGNRYRIMRDARGSAESQAEAEADS